MIPVPGNTLGNDFSGTVEAIGSKVKKSWSVGDRICGLIAANNIVHKDDGTFAEFCVANGELSMKIPDGMSDNEAASPGVGIGTAGSGLFHLLGMVLPGEEEGGKGEPVLIYGGTSATGTMAIQLAKL